MKKLVILGIAIFMAGFCFTLKSTSVTLNVIEKTGYQDYDITLKNNSTPYVAYIDGTSKTLKLAKKDGGQFQIETVDSSGKVRENVAIEFDGDNNIGIAYTTGSYSGQHLVYAFYNNSSWNIDTIFENVDPYVGDLLFDNNNSPYILYTKFVSTTQGLFLAKINNLQWVIDTIEAENVAGRATAVFDQNNGLHIAYRKTTKELIYAVKSGSNLSKSTLISTLNNASQVLQIRMASTQQPVIACVTGNDTVRFYKFDGASWNNQFICKTYTGTGCYMDLSTNDNPQFSKYQSYTVRHVSWNGTTASETDIQSLVQSTQIKSPITVDANNDFHLLYYYQDTLRYATSSTGSVSYSLTVSTDELDVEADAGSTSFSVTSNTTWSISCDANWLTISPSSGSNNSSVTVNYSANTSTSERTATITITGTGVDAKTITVTQEAIVASISVVPVSNIVPAAGGDVTFEVNSTITWTATVDEDWLSIDPSSGGDGDIITVTCEENTSAAERTATITVSGSGVSDISLTVTQEGAAVAVCSSQLDKIMVFPNPVIDVLTLQNLDLNTGISIYAITGQKLAVYLSSSNNYEINMSGFANGLYLIRISENNETRSLTIIKK